MGLKILTDVTSAVDERSEVCISNRGQDSSVQTDLARLVRCLIYRQTRNQKNKASFNLTQI